MRALIAVIFSLVPAFVSAQSFPLYDSPTSLAVLDGERLFAESRYGQSFIAEFEARAVRIAQENREIEAALEAEELELTRLRASEPQDSFAQLAEAFDQKANRIRAERRQAALDLVNFRETAQQQFFQEVGPVLLVLMQERRIGAIIDRDSVVISLPNIDLTDEAIRRIDTVFGD